MKAEVGEVRMGKIRCTAGPGKTFEEVEIFDGEKGMNWEQAGNG
jgi:hypothetical protein